MLALALAVIAAGMAALRYRSIVLQHDARVAAMEQGLRMRDEEAVHLAQHRLPALTGSAWQGGGEVPGPLHPALAGSSFAHAMDSVLEMFSAANKNADQAAQELLLAVARKLQGLANNQQLKITEMTKRHDNPVFLEDLMHIDHTNAQVLRRAVGMAVVCGAWPGRQHQATSLHDVVRGAIGRILDYKRVHIVRIEDTRHVTGRVVEPLVMTIAELLENATRSSHPSTPVQVHVQLTHSGLAFVIEDAGVGLNVAERQKVMHLLGNDSLGMADLGNPPCFGLAACGALARRYGFSVWVDSASAFGGARAVVNVPGALLTDSVAASRPPVAAVLGVAAAAPGTNGIAEPRSTTVHGLPKRARQQPVAGAMPSGPVVTADRSPSQAAAPLSAFQRAGMEAAHRTRPSAEGSATDDPES